MRKLNSILNSALVETATATGLSNQPVVEAINRPAMRLAIWIGWQSLFQPADVRRLSLSNRHRDGSGTYLKTARAKTGREAFAAISDDLSASIDAYVSGLGFEVPRGAPFLRTVRGLSKNKGII